MDHCDECHFDYAAHQPPDLLREVDEASGEIAARLRSAARRHEDGSGARRSPGSWSVLEYACHVRDVLLTQRDRVLLALVEDDPSFPRMYRDERVVLARYGEQDPGRVADELAVAAGLFSWVGHGISPQAWDRACTYNFPAPTPRTLRWLAQHTLHEVRHHLFDVERILAAPGS